MGNTNDIAQKHYNMAKNCENDRNSYMLYLCLSYLEGGEKAEEQLTDLLSENKIDYIFCNQKLQETSEILKKKTFCPTCGRILKNNTAECSICAGTERSKRVSSKNDMRRRRPDRNLRRRKKKKKNVVLLGVACASVICIGAGIWMNRDKIESFAPDAIIEILSKLPFWKSSDGADIEAFSVSSDTAQNGIEENIGTQVQIPIGQVSASTADSATGLDGVTTLDMQKMGIADLSLYSNAYSLESLNLYGNPFSDLQPISGLINLKKLIISNSGIFSIEPLSELVNLEELSFGETQVSDISPVKNLTNLRVIDFWKTPVSDISVLAELTSLEFVSISYTNVSDLSALMYLPDLSELGMQGLSISKDQYNEFVSLHPNCTVYDNGTIYY